MIKINLRPGAAKKGGRRRRSVGLPRGGLKLPSMDRWVAAIVAAWIIAPLLLAWLFIGTQGRRGELETAIEEAQRDSASYARLIATNTTLQARRDTIAEKLQVIQQIDAGRYVWPHIMDEVSRTLPDYTWLTKLTQNSGGPQPQFQIEGRTGTTFALTRYLNSLEASPFISQVRLVSTVQTDLEGKQVYDFIITGHYEEPPPELVETVPVFEIDAGDEGQG